MQYTSTVHSLHGHTRVVPRCLSWNWSTPLRFHRVWPTQCQVSHSDEVLSSVIITTAKQITMNIACVSCIQSSYSTLIDTPRSTRPTANIPIDAKCVNRDIRCWKVPLKDLNKGDNLDPGPVSLQRPDACEMQVTLYCNVAVVLCMPW